MQGLRVYSMHLAHLYMAQSYEHKAIEKKWQEYWQERAVYATDEDAAKPKSYVLDMFPYPSGEGLHVGHPKGYIATDIYSRMKRMQGFNVLHPMGWDAFGLPAENYAIKNKVHPRAAVEKNVAYFKEQLGKIGFNYDWGREVNTTDPEFYKWTQWIFLQLFKRGLAYESHEPINWCPSCQTGLSNEDLDDGNCERCGSEVEQRPMRQWVLKITAYADRLLDDLQLLPHWQEHIKESQRNWIGRSEGAEIDFALSGRAEKVTVFTTRPDTLYGATYMVLAPEHPLVEVLVDTIENKDEVRAYQEATRKKTELERQENKEKTGCVLQGVQAINPANQKEIPVYIADYVLAHYGTGAIMAVPAHDERDHAFAKQFNLPVVKVVEPQFIAGEGESKVREGQPFVFRDAVCVVVHNPKDDTYLGIKWKDHHMHGLVTGGLDSKEDLVTAARREVLEETGYKSLRLIERGEQALHSFFYHRVKKENRHARFQYVFFQLEGDSRDKVSAEEAALHDVVWVPRSQLASFFTVIEGEFMNKLIATEGYVHTDPGVLVNSDEFSGMDSEEVKQKIVERVGGRLTKTYRLKDWVFSRQRYWGEPIPIVHCEVCGAVPVPEEQLPVLLPDVESYAPTGTGESPLADIAEWVNTECPHCGGKGKRETNTMPQWAGSSWYYLRYMDPHNADALVDPAKEKYWAPVDLYVGGAEHATRHLIYARFWHKVLFDMGVVSTSEPFERLISVGLIMAEDGRKMSKRYGNVINPDDIVDTYGADTLRVYEMFMGPFTDAIAWNTENMIGSRRFLERLWRLAHAPQATTAPEVHRELHRTIKKVGEDIDSFKFNTAIAQMMILLNIAEKEGMAKGEVLTFVKLLAPFAPHVADELFSCLGGERSVHEAPWPAYDETLLHAAQVTLGVQINGKLKGEITVASGADEETVRAAAQQACEKWLEGKEVKKCIYVPGRVINFVVV